MTTGRRQKKRRGDAVVAFPDLTNARRTYPGPDRIIDAIRQALIVLDEHLHVVTANRAFYRAFNVIPEQAVGRHVVDIGDHRLDVPALRDFFGLLQVEDAAIADYEMEIELPGLGARVLLLSAEKIRGKPETTTQVVVEIDDVTERRRAETTLRSAKWHAERANLNKSRFLAVASHDLRQPLQALSLLRGNLAKKIKDKKNAEALKLVVRLNETADTLLDTLDTLLAINQLEFGNIRPEKVDFPINDLLERLRIEFSYHVQTHGLIWDVVPCCLSICTDPRLLEQMIRNLLSNAVKHTERGKILLGCRRRGDKLRIEVWDTGAGIPKAQIHAIFAEFSQLDNSVRKHSRGLGLGLSIVQRLAHMLGHSIDVQSRLGKGSVFAVEVPLADEQSAAPFQLRQWETTKNARRDATILVVDSDPTVCEMLDLLLSSEGYRTATAADGKQALALARGTIKPDLVVADYTLSNGLTGLQVVAGVRGVLNREIPAVIFAGDISTDTTREIIRRGCMQRAKPFKAEELTHLIQSLLTGQRRSKVQTASSPPTKLNAETQQPTIFIVDDEVSVREAMRGLLQEQGWEVEVYSSGEAFLDTHRPGRGGCLVVDARMPRMDGLELLERLKTRDGGLPAIMVTGHADVRLAVRAMKAGAVAFLEKPVEYHELIVNIERALELTRNSAALSSFREAAAKRLASLTVRERQVVKMVTEGNPNKQVAYVLGLSQRTVETHRATAMKKLGARTLSELIHLTIAGSPRDN